MTGPAFQDRADEAGASRTVGATVAPDVRSAVRSERDTWIIVCEHFHGAVGPIPTEQLAVDLAAEASEIGACTYRPVPLTLAQGRRPGRADEDSIYSTA